MVCRPKQPLKTATVKGAFEGKQSRVDYNGAGLSASPMPNYLGNLLQIYSYQLKPKSKLFLSATRHPPGGCQCEEMPEKTPPWGVFYSERIDAILLTFWARKLSTPP